MSCNPLVLCSNEQWIVFYICHYLTYVVYFTAQCAISNTRVPLQYLPDRQDFLFGKHKAIYSCLFYNLQGDVKTRMVKISGFQRQVENSSLMGRPVVWETKLKSTGGNTFVNRNETANAVE